MDTKIILNGALGKKNVNTDEGVNVSLGGKRKFLPYSDMSEVISQNDQYNEERASSNIIRLTCQVNPVCSNVLFNRISEIVRDEGSPNVSFINYKILNDGLDVKFKKSDIDFWGSGAMKYESYVEDYIDVDTPLPEVLELDCAHKLYGNGEITSNIKHPTNSIRDTQLSNEDNNFIYHCGLDILNNHLIRSKTFKTVCRVKEDGDWTDNDGFNTIADVMRDVVGTKVFEKIPFPISANIDRGAKIVALHLYEYDDVDTFANSIKNNLIPKYDGWVGFYNKSKIKSYLEFYGGKNQQGEINVSEELKVDKPLMYMNGGDFVDMYPDRSLYSFIPKYNKFRDRIEKNWNYCITYPSSSTTKGFSDILETNNGINSLKAVYFDENTIGDNGVTQLVIYSIAKHGLKQGDFVNIYNTYENNGETTTDKILDNAEVKEVVDDYIFVIFNADVKVSNKWVSATNERGSIIDELTVDDVTYHLDRTTRKFYYTGTSMDTKYYIIEGKSGYKYVNLDDNAQNLSYKKVVWDIECEYYVRIFSRLPNFKYASGDTSTEYEIYREREDGKSMLETYRTLEYDFESHVSRLAFARNIYSDAIGEIVYTDDLNLNGIKDNLGRPLSSLYLTIVKNNAGYKEWYGFDKAEVNIASENVEFSHCFGKVTCGIDTSDESIYSGAKSIKVINNLSVNSGYDVDLINGDRDSKDSDTAEISPYEVWYKYDENYYGDLCYYDNYNAIEVSIQPILHRFNTAQRESEKASRGEYFQKYMYDEIKFDDYDGGYNYKVEGVESNYTCNNLKEGYYYIPHYEIPIHTFDKIETVFPDFLTIQSLINNENGSTITTEEHHYLSIGDKCVLFDRENNKYYDCLTVAGDNDSYNRFTCKMYDERGNEVSIPDIFSNDERIGDYELFKMDNLNIPDYARVLKDGTCRVIWRNLIKNGFDNVDESVEKYPFTNGALYINRRIDLYLRRQDPHKKYGLYDDKDLLGNEVDITEIDNYVKENDIEC